MTAIVFILGTMLLAALGLIVELESRELDERYVQCPRCHLMLDKERIPVSGYNSEHSSEHIHCPRCKAYIAI